MKKTPPPPLFSLKHEYVASLEVVLAEATMMLTAVETVVQHGDLKPAVREVLNERAAKLRAAMYDKE